MIGTRELTWEMVCSKPPLEGMRLDSVMVYYRNDEQEGFGVGLERKPGTYDLEEDLHRAFDAYKAGWDRADKERQAKILSHYVAQVEDAARHRYEDRYPTIILIMNIIWLVFYAGLPQDEYNGPQFIWVNSAHTLLVGNQ